MNIALFDTDFLKKLNEQHNHIIYARIISLNFSELPLEQIEGRVTGGNINIDGSSAIRRSCSLTFTAKDLKLHDYYWSLNTKIKVEIGLQNDINDNYDKIIWFPQGIYLITSFNISQATNNYTVSITGKDKMSLLNGEIGGYLGLQTTFDKYDESITSATDPTKIEEVVTHKELIKRIITDLVNTYGHEPFSNIIINDLDIYGLNQLDFNKWEDSGGTEMYLVYDETTSSCNEVVNSLRKLTNYIFEGCLTMKVSDESTWSLIHFKDYLSVNKTSDADITYFTKTALNSNDEASLEGLDQKEKDRLKEDILSHRYSIVKIISGQICGYAAQDLIYDEDLIGNSTDTVTSVLDKIVKKLGEFEYFYNLDGQFVFQEKKTYVQSSWNNLISTNKDSYVDPNEASKYLTYSFEGSNLITSFQNNPNINNIKNDYIIWGEKTSSLSSTKIPIHAHYAIDKKPKYYRTLAGVEYVTDSNLSDKLKALNNYEKKIPPWAEYFNPEKKDTIVDGLSGEALEAKYKDVCENWWDIQDWAEYYSLLTGEYPNQALYNYQFYYDRLNLENMFTISRYVWSEWKLHPCGIFDVYPAYSTGKKHGILGFVGHNPSWSNKYKDLEEWTVHNVGIACGQKYSDYFLKLYSNIIEENTGCAYIYKPQIPINVQSQFVQVTDWREILYQMALDYANNKNKEDFLYQVAQQNPDYYPTGVTGYEQYYTDIENYWRKLYDPSQIADITSSYNKYQGWHEDVYENPTNLTFWFDFFNCEGNDLERFSVPVVGPRSKVVNDNTIKLITHEEVPNIIFLTNKGETTYESIISNYSYLPGYLYINDLDLYDKISFTLSTKGKTAQEMAETLLYNYGQANETITIQAIPIYYLEPNTLIYVHDQNSNINNIYIINKISLSLTYNGMMTINATKMPDPLT